MTKIKVSELFYSLQGEGAKVGVPSVFLRTFGCPFTCSGFGMKRGELSQERFEVDPKDYTDYRQLPLVHTGCDSYASWDVRFKHLSPLMETRDIVTDMEKLLPQGKFGRDKHLIITGGEPLLGWQKAYPELIDDIFARRMGLTDITFETNGTQPLSDKLYDYMERSFIDITFSVSAKLPVSGEKWEDAIKPEIVKQYSEVQNGTVYLKFVVQDEQDIADVERAAIEYESAGVDVPIYLMPVGGTTETYAKFERHVADYARDNGYIFSPRIQVPLYRNQWGT